LAVPPERVTVLEAASVVKAPVEAVVAPMVIPLIVPPVRVAPLDESVFKVAVDDAPRVVKLPAAGVTLPIIPWNDVPVATPKTGVTRVGEVANTLLPVPVLVTETMFLLASNANAVEAVKPDSVVVLDADRVVNAPVPAVVAPTGPLNESPAAPV
jgi:hypothetical protein